MKKILTLFIVSIFVLTAGAQSSNLALNLEKGTTYKQVTNSTSNITQEVYGQSMNIAMTMNGTMLFQVKSIDDEGFDMRVRIEKLAMNMTMPNGKMDFSSDKNDSSDVFSSILRQMTTTSFDIKMTKSGKVANINNVDQIWESVINNFTQVPEAQRTQMKNQIMNAYGGAALKGNIEMVTAIFPEQKVKKGDKWSVETKLESGMAAKVNTEYEFSDNDENYHLISGHALFETANKDAYVETNGMPLKYDLSGTIESKIKVDKSTGWIIEADIKQDIKGNAYIKENQQVPDGMTIPMTIKSEMLITNN